MTLEELEDFYEELTRDQQLSHAFKLALEDKSPDDKNVQQLVYDKILELAKEFKFRAPLPLTKSFRKP